YALSGGAPAESYLNQERILDAAVRARAEAIHPGYGFLAENAAFGRACADAGIVWIGPPPEAIEAMGSKIEARERMRAAGVPIVTGTTASHEPAERQDPLRDEIGCALARTASAGRGAEDLKMVRTREQAPPAP